MPPSPDLGTHSPNRPHSTGWRAALELSIRAAYTAYSAQHLDGLLGLVASDVDWPDGDSRLHGPGELRRYWTEQWSRTRTADAPTSLAWLQDAVCAVVVEQTVRGLGGEVLSRARLVHILQMHGLLIARLDIVPLAEPHHRVIPEENKEPRT